VAKNNHPNGQSSQPADSQAQPEHEEEDATMEEENIMTDRSRAKKQSTQASNQNVANDKSQPGQFLCAADSGASSASAINGHVHAQCRASSGRNEQNNDKMDESDDTGQSAAQTKPAHIATDGRLPMELDAGQASPVKLRDDLSYGITSC
jgi:hypothetical protein